MIINLLCTAFVGWSFAKQLRRTAMSTPLAPVAPVAASGQPIPGVSPPTGPEDDSAGWPAGAVRGDWTALDERQLIRLLTESPS